MHEYIIREFLRGCPSPVLRKVDGSVNPDWVSIKAIVEDRHISQEDIDVEVAHEERIVDEMLGLRATPQYPLPDDKERTFNGP